MYIYKSLGNLYAFRILNSMSHRSQSALDSYQNRLPIDARLAIPILK